MPRPPCRRRRWRRRHAAGMGVACRGGVTTARRHLVGRRRPDVADGDAQLEAPGGHVDCRLGHRRECGVTGWGVAGVCQGGLERALLANEDVGTCRGYRSPE
jgi:hypothetical protein